MTSAQNGNSRSARFLGSFPMFISVPIVAVRDLERNLIFWRYGSRSVVYRQGDEAEGIYFVFEGRLSTSAVAMDSKTALLKIAKVGEVLGLAAVMSGQPHLTTAVATVPSVLALLRREHLAGAMRNYAQFSEAVAQSLAMECKEYARDMLLLRVPCSSSQKLAAALVRLADGRAGVDSRELGLTYTHSELGQLIGASRETVARLMKRFQRQGVITTKRSAFQIADLRTLREMGQID